MENIIIATIKSWHIDNFYQLEKQYKNKYKFYLIKNKDDLSYLKICKINPRYIFFPHWSWTIPKNIYSNYECVVFHMTDLPFGRGGSPLQNLVVNQIYNTKISALKVADGLDTGDIYIKQDFNIEIGSAEEIFIRLSNIIFDKIIPNFLNSKLEAVPQIGETITFTRRTPKDSDLEKLEAISLIRLYDFIRMLDAEGYPKAYVKLGNYKVEFSEVHLKNKKIVGRFEVIKDE